MQHHSTELLEQEKGEKQQSLPSKWTSVPYPDISKLANKRKEYTEERERGKSQGCLESQKGFSVAFQNLALQTFFSF